MAELDGVESGAPLPLGASLSPSGINLAVFGRHAEAVSVLLYDDRAAREPSAQVRLDPCRRRTGDIWHVRIPAEFKVEAYSLQVDGPRGLLEGHRCDPRDGASENFSENNETEGATANPVTEAVRLRQIKNMHATLFITRGVPMLLGGDEFRRSQAGNNNACCQDNEISWYDWSMAKTNAGLVRFVSCLAALRRAHL